MKKKIIKEDFSLVAFLLIFMLSFIIMYIYLENKHTYTITKETVEQSVETRLENLQEQIDLYTKKEVINQDKMKTALSIIKTDSLRREVESLFRDVEIEQNTDKLIAKVPTSIIATKEAREVFLQQVNVVIHNTSEDTMGSGVTLKYNGKFYILSAGHMAEEETDQLELWENNTKICDLEIVKHDYTFDNKVTTEEEFYNSNDLMLLKPKDDSIEPKIYTELAEYEPRIGADVYIVGNPMGIEDVVSEGRILKYIGNYMYISDNIYFGNSGGGVYSKEGKLLGIVSHLYPYQPKSDVPAWMTYGIIRLNTIKFFLENTNEKIK